jgi:hypothetical protein
MFRQIAVFDETGAEKRCIDGRNEAHTIIKP